MPMVELQPDSDLQPRPRPPKHTVRWLVLAAAVVVLAVAGWRAGVFGAMGSWSWAGLIVAAVAVLFGVVRARVASPPPPASKETKWIDIVPPQTTGRTGLRPVAKGPGTDEPEEEAFTVERGREERRETPAEDEHDVLISVSAPASAEPGSQFVARFAAYTPLLRDGTLELLHRLAGDDQVFEDVRESRWAENTKVTVRLTARGLAVDPPEQTFTWRGARNLLDFVVDVPSGIEVQETLLRFEVIIFGFDVAPIALPLEIGRAAGTERETTTVQPARTAFASYAHQDKLRVLDRVAAVRIAANLDVFLDCLSLRPNEKWKPELERKIVESDLFLLFWSQAASASPWVTWEWKTAWARKPHDRFQLQPLAYADPPPEWADLQADDVLIALRELEERRRAEQAAAVSPDGTAARSSTAPAESP